MGINMNIGEITIKFLTDHKYDGLCNSDYECGCGVDDFAPCGDSFRNCKPAYKMKDTSQQSGEYDEYYTTEKQTA